MGAGCCKAVDELNPDGKPKDPQTKEQRKEDAKDLRRTALAADWSQMRVLLRRMPLRQICSGADKQEATGEDLGNTALHNAVSINHLRGVKKLLRYGVPPGIRNKAGKAALHFALEAGRLKAAWALMEKDMALRNDTGATPAPAAAMRPNLINMQDGRGVSPLLAVVAAGRLKLTREVLGMCKELEVSVDFGLHDAEGNSLLSYAAKWGWWDELEAWLDKVPDPARLLNTQNKQGETVLGHVLLFAASPNLLPRPRARALVSKLLSAGALVVLPAFRERVPPLALAAATDDKELYDMLRGKGADPFKARDTLGRSPLHFAAARGALQLAGELLDAGLKAYALDAQRNTPLHLASMRGQKAMVDLLLERADDKIKALLTPNKSGMSAYHLALTAGSSDKAQSSSLALIDALGSLFTSPVLGRKKAVVDTPLLLAIQGHQDRVVRALLEKGCSPKEANSRGEIPLARVLASATATTYETDSAILDMLIAAGVDMGSAGEAAHPMIAICKNNLSKFAENAVRVLTERCGTLNWDKRDDKGYTPLGLAAFHNNAWLVRYLIDEVGLDPNSHEQATRATAPEVVGTTGVLCLAKPLTLPGTVEGQTPLMCAAKGASLAAVQLLLNRGADVNSVDSLGRTALQHAMHMDKPESLQVAAALLQFGARPERGTRQQDGGFWSDCRDLVGESWLHRAVRYGCSSFLALWAGCGGNLELLATTADDADDMPGAELKVEEKADFLDYMPNRTLNQFEEEDEELVDDYNGKDSEEAPAEEDGEGGQGPAPDGAGAVAEGLERRNGGGGSSSEDEDDCGDDEDLAAAFAAGQAISFYSGPTPRMMLRWRRRNLQWWDEFWVDKSGLPDQDLEDDPHEEDKYTLCEEGDDWIDEEDVEDEIWEGIRAEQRAAAAEYRRQLLREQQQQQQGVEGPVKEPDVEAVSLGIQRVSSGLTHRLFRRRLPGAAVPPEDARDADEGTTFAAGSPGKWLRRRPSATNGGGRQTAAAAATAAQQLPVRGACAAAGPVSEGLEDVLVEDFEEPGGDMDTRSDDIKAAAMDTDQRQRSVRVSSSVRRDNVAFNPDEGRAPVGASGGSVGSLSTDYRSKSLSRNTTVNASKSFKQSFTMSKGMLTAGTSGEKLYGNEDYYQPETRYLGLPRYMNVDVSMQPPHVYEKIVADFHARVRAYDIPNDKLLVGPELRARNIVWYHKSMSPVEYPLKQGKWKSFQRMSAKAVEEAKLRRPRKPGEKPKIRNKKGGWFGLPPLPSRPELAATTPLLYAVRLARRKCVEVLLRYSGASASIPDAHGLTPLSYAMFMLAKERHNKTLQQITDLLLASRPLVNPAAIWKLQLMPRMKAEIDELQAAAATKGGDTKLSRRAQEKRAMFELMTTHYAPERFPTIMEPLVLAALLGDIPRMTVLVKELGANVNAAWVWLPDIPTYFRGQWEKQVGRCHSRVTALHVAICHKKFETVRALLDLGADPNMAGAEYTGDYAKDLARHIKQQRAREEAVRRSKDAGAAHNPYVKLWQDKTSSLVVLFSAVKRFLSSIEIPGFTRPHPWLSPLHLAARMGAADVAFLLLQRGALPNGGPAGAAAPRSPLEEALLYARANAQSYGTTSERINYRRILELACLEETADNAADIQQALQKQSALRTELTLRLREKAAALAAKLPKDKNGKPMTPETVLAGAKAVLDVGARLADYSRAGLEKLPPPGMNILAVANLSKKMMKDALAMMDPVKGAIKAVVFAAKIIVKLLLEMMRRPIAHHDPALACAHVFLYFRAPINVSEKQSGILVRDILDNGNSFPGADTRLSYYRWLGLSPAVISDDVWVASVVNNVAVLKTNISYGYMVFDLTTDAREYKQKKKKFMAAVESAVLNIGMANLMPYYLRHVIEEAVDALQPTDTALSATREAAVTKAQQAFKRRILWSYDENGGGARGQPGVTASGSVSRALLVRLFDSYINFMATMRMREMQAEAQVAAGGMTAVPAAAAASGPTTEIADEVARSLLPQWLYTAPDAAAAAGASTPAAPVPEVPRNRAAVVDFLVSRFLRCETAAPAPMDFSEAPVPNFWDKLLDPKTVDPKFEWPSIPPAQVEAMRPTLEDVSDMDVCAAVVRAINALTVQRSTALSRILLEEASVAAKAAEEAFAQRLSVAAAEKAQRIQKMLETRLDLIQFDEGPIFEAALMAPMWEAAAQKLGGGPAAQALVGKLRSAVASGQLPRIEDPLELARRLGADVMELGPGELVAELEAQLGRALPPQLAKELTQVLTSPVESSLATAGNSLEQTAPPDLESFIERAEDELGSSAASMLRALQEAAAAAQAALDPEVLAEELIESIRQNGGLMLITFWENKLGRPLPDSVRKEVEKGAKPFAEQLMAKYEEGGLSAAIGAATVLTGGVAVAVSSGLVEEVHGTATAVINNVMSNIEAKTGLVLPEVHNLSDLMNPDRLVATASAVRDQVVDAVQGLDIGTVAKMAADGGIKLPGTLGTVTVAAGDLFQQVVLGKDALMADADAAADKAQEAIQRVLAGDPSAALSGLAGKIPLPQHLAKVSGVLSKALKEANTELTGLANTAKQLEESVRTLTSGAVQELEGLSEQLVSAGRQLLTVMESQLDDAADEMMAGLELMMSMDAQALAAELEEAQEALMHIMEVLGIDEML